MGIIRGTVRLGLFFGILLALTPSVIILSFLPFITYRNATAAAWLITFTCRFILKLFDIQTHCSDISKIREHDGFVFPNHISYLDVVVVMHLTPMRFLAKEEVGNWFLIGQIAGAVGTIFVKRENKDSRKSARDAIQKCKMPPPMALFPEGKTGPGGKLLPFRYGAFEIAMQTGKPYILCPIVYNREKIVCWAEEPLLKAAWRLASRRGTITAEITPLSPVYASVDDDPKQLAHEAEQAMLAVLPYKQALER